MCENIGISVSERWKKYDTFNKIGKCVWLRNVSFEKHHSKKIYFFSWATPCKSLSVNTFNIGGTTVKDNYELNVYERNVQVSEMRSVDAGLLLDILRISLPEGVDISVHEHLDAEHFEARYIPDPFVEGLKTQLSEIEDKKEDEMGEKKKVREAKDAKRKETLLASLEEADEYD